MPSNKICPECKYNDWKWCKQCNAKRLQNDFDKWTSRNDAIDKIIQDTQLNANKMEVVEWISYDRLEHIKQIGRGGFGTIHLAKWIDGPICKWDTVRQKWKDMVNLT